MVSTNEMCVSYEIGGVIMATEKKFRLTKHGTPDYVKESIVLAKSIAGQVRRHEGIKFSKNDKINVYRYAPDPDDIRKFKPGFIIEYVIYDGGTPVIWFEMRNKILTCVPVSIKDEKPINMKITDFIY